MERRTYNPCDECPHGIDRRDGSGNDAMCRICEFNAYLKLGPIDHLRDLLQAEKDGRLVKYLPGDTVYDRFGMEWTVTSSEIHRFGDGTLCYLYRCGHPGTNDYCALYSDEILTREEAEAALQKEASKQ